MSFKIHNKFSAHNHFSSPNYVMYNSFHNAYSPCSMNNAKEIELNKKKLEEYRRQNPCDKVNTMAVNIELGGEQNPTEKNDKDAFECIVPPN